MTDRLYNTITTLLKTYTKEQIIEKLFEIASRKQRYEFISEKTFIDILDRDEDYGFSPNDSELDKEGKMIDRTNLINEFREITKDDTNAEEYNSFIEMFMDNRCDVWAKPIINIPLPGRETLRGGKNKKNRKRTRKNKS